MKIHINDGIGHVWNCFDVQELREAHRIVGTLIGCLPRKPRQNQQMSLPLELLPEEVSLLHRRGIAELVDGDKEVFNPSQQQIDFNKDFRRQSYLEQVELCKAEKKRDLLRNREQIIAGKKKKAAKIREQKIKQGLLADEDNVAIDDFNIDDIPIKPITELQALIQIPTEDPWSVDLLPAVWSYPSSDRQRLRCRVFEDLWERGYFLTSGNKFGGDFLVYPGDPALVHSMYIAVCRPYDCAMNALEIVSMGRVGTNVKKTLLLCSVDNSTGNLVYTSLQWTGIV